MNVIEKAIHKLVEKTQSFCQEFSTPSFKIVSAKLGLPCKWFKSETKSVKSHLYQCQKYKFETEKIHPNYKEIENLMYCDYCNS